MSNEAFDVHAEEKKPPNWHIVNCTTPAQYFHVLRRQMLRNYRKPLIVISPKSLLKSPLAVSSWNDFSPGTRFKPVLSDTSIKDTSKVKKVVFISGKFYYDVFKERAAKGFDDEIALVRVEELSPFPKQELQKEIAKYEQAQNFVWCQEEPQNAGAYSFMAPRIAQLLPENKTIEYVGRKALSAPAIGIPSIFKNETNQLLSNILK
ncbi:hypothetical protein BDF20DRAFT_60541 [Mycotypha africana]|uniref:uncharacterized protein n=1 Tax=Mycotypha africana TaxID=64632 RepID=UPI002300DCB5|nr:uncharacterized protein BDF20DRAFT_60541 [Mycotypha africana]KAI8991756.1 hypothetical protein BDF20DRAFT_60541 [Mycotypha africana]